MMATRLLSLAALVAALGCGGPAQTTRKTKRVVFPPPKAVDHLESVMEVVETPPTDGAAAWAALSGPQGPAMESLFYPGWDTARRSAATTAAWKTLHSRWGDLRVGLYRLQNQFEGTVPYAARTFAKVMGSLPPTTVHLYLVPDLRAGAASYAGGKGVIGLNSVVLATLGEAALERELVRQLAVVAALSKGDVPDPPPLQARLYLEGFSSWAVRAVQPHTLEAEVAGCTPEQLSAARAKIRDVSAAAGPALASRDAALIDRLLVHGDGDATMPIATRLASMGLVRSYALDSLPADVLAMGYPGFAARATSYFRPAGSGVGGALVEQRSAAEDAVLARGGKTNECVGPFPGPGARVDAPVSGPVTLGLIGDIKRADDDTLRNVAYFVAEFRKAGVSAVLVPGDVAETGAGIEDALEVLATVGVPVLVIPGNRESWGRYKNAMAKVRAQHDNLVDMSRVRLYEAGAFSVVSLPGYYDPRYTYAKDGCLYQPADVAQLATIAAASKASTKILMAHSPPKARGRKAIDWADAGANVGDPEMTKVLKTGAFRIGVYANLHEAGGRAVRTDLKTKVRPGTWVREIHLVTGSANAMPWPMLDGRVSEGMAGLLDLRKGKARYRILRVPGH